MPKPVERPPYIGVIGAGECEAALYEQARALGREIARAGAVLVCGGLGGVMDAACRGAREHDGVTIGLLPGEETDDANPYVQYPIAAGIGYARNYIIINTADVLIAVGGSYGTLSEIGFALKAGKKVIGIETFDLGEDIIPADSPAHAVELALNALESA